MKQCASLAQPADRAQALSAITPDVLMTVHVHGVELLLVLLTLVFLHVLQHLVGHVLRQDGKHKVFL